MSFNIWFIFVFCCMATVAANFSLVFEGIRVISYNKEMIADVHNNIKSKPPTGFVVSYSFVVLKTINVDQARVTAKVFTFNSNTGEYNLQPLRIVKRICDEFKKKYVVDLSDMINYGNVTGCGIMKPGFYAINEYEPQLKLPDLRILFGRYKLNSVVQTGKTFLMEVDFYSRIDA